MPKIEYKLKSGERVSGVTTIIGQNLGWGKNQLMWWAWNEGKEGRDFRETKERAADAGTLAHYLIDCDIKGKTVEIPETPKEVYDKAYQCYFNYLEWKRAYNLKVYKTEISLVSEKHKYGLTPDCIAFVSDRLSIADYKTSNAVYPEMLIQLAAYGKGWEENFPEEKLAGGFHLLRIGKDDISFHHHFWLNLDDAWKIFKHLLEIHELHKSMKGKI
jgi:hypothetical protein